MKNIEEIIDSLKKAEAPSIDEELMADNIMSIIDTPDSHPVKTIPLWATLTHTISTAAAVIAVSLSVWNSVNTPSDNDMSRQNIQVASCANTTSPSLYSTYNERRTSQENNYKQIIKRHYEHNN